MPNGPLLKRYANFRSANSLRKYLKILTVHDKKYNHRGTETQKRLNKSLVVKQKLTQTNVSHFFDFISVPL
jgi:hypothetical protein